MDTQQVMSLKYTNDKINLKRDEVRAKFLNRSKNIKSGEISAISRDDLYVLYELYDGIFLESFLKDNLKERLSFSLSNRMSRNAGKTVYRKDSFEIVMAVKFFFNYGSLKRDKKVNGIITRDALNALQLVFEHEICHVIEFYLFKRSSCKKKIFKTLAFSLFGHTDVYHQLPTEREIVGSVYNLRVGDKVTFSSDNKKYVGIINSINKRATVMVRDSKGMYADRYGNRYTNWYVLIKNLKIY